MTARGACKCELPVNTFGGFCGRCGAEHGLPVGTTAAARVSRRRNTTRGRYVPLATCESRQVSVSHVGPAGALEAFIVRLCDDDGVVKVALVPSAARRLVASILGYMTPADRGHTIESAERWAREFDSMRGKDMSAPAKLTRAEVEAAIRAADMTEESPADRATRYATRRALAKLRNALAQARATEGVTIDASSGSRELARLLGELFSGLSVPGSLGALGAADGPWRELRNRWKLRGYQGATEIAEKIVERERRVDVSIDLAALYSIASTMADAIDLAEERGLASPGMIESARAFRAFDGTPAEEMIRTIADTLGRTFVEAALDQFEHDILRGKGRTS